MNIRKTGSIILSGIFAASLFSGCGKTISETGNMVAPGETSAAFTLPSETYAQDPVTPVEPKTFEEVYGNQLMGYLNHQYYFDGEPVSLQESNFYFINAFLELSSDANMGYYPVALIWLPNSRSRSMITALMVTTSSNMRKMPSRCL